MECLKTCCGALAILAKDEANKLLIARDGTRLILTVMEGHATRPDLQVLTLLHMDPPALTTKTVERKENDLAKIKDRTISCPNNVTV